MALPNCLFCQKEKLKIIKENEVALAVLDIYPVSEGHSLIIPKNHSLNVFEMDEVDRIGSLQLMDELKLQLQAEDPTITGFNVVSNCGEDAGQTVFHSHIHLIPRRPSDGVQF